MFSNGHFFTRVTPFFFKPSIECITIGCPSETQVGFHVEMAAICCASMPGTRKLSCTNTAHVNMASLAHNMGRFVPLRCSCACKPVFTAWWTKCDQSLPLQASTAKRGTRSRHSIENARQQTLHRRLNRQAVRGMLAQPPRVSTAERVHSRPALVTGSSRTPRSFVVVLRDK